MENFLIHSFPEKVESSSTFFFAMCTETTDRKLVANYLKKIDYCIVKEYLVICNDV